MPLLSVSGSFNLTCFYIAPLKMLSLSLDFAFHGA